ncbi:polysaccharide biosynthesis/export family protein [Thalassorhabdomicrobium marinisediminis]|uniref:polysaccharide biosynthesis/export family protein n=1 Tax=Thalassorhabdomicrobium marinisediminis TaxID=2170577 RepID=UPI002492F543|nr:polysaccharide biosynthesis/export family protein [Thalassorhabdomicrobium marinisediminis]
MKHVLLLLCCAVALSGCSFFPRGAGLQSEVLAEARLQDSTEAPDFAVEAVTRANLVTFLAWPVPNHQRYPWIDRVDQPNNRIIAAGDTLKITIWSTEDNGLLTAPGQRFVTLPDMRVSSSGTIFLPYVDTVRVSGMSPEHARATIEARYSNVTPSAQVQVELIEGRQRTVSLVSGVAAPGTYPLADNDVTLLDLIAESGGISAALVNPQVRLQRGGRMFGISADQLLDSPSRNTTLEGGDRIFIEADEKTFLSLGAAGQEAIHTFPKDNLTALEAMSMIGGIEDNRADAQGILILRRYPVAAVTADRSGPDHPRTVFTIDLTSADGLFSADQFLIAPGDLVYVTESPATTFTSILSALGAVLRLR